MKTYSTIWKLSRQGSTSDFERYYLKALPERIVSKHQQQRIVLVQRELEVSRRSAGKSVVDDWLCTGGPLGTAECLSLKP
ncbi:MAG: hypothetical protein NT069_22650 [Planctomycetota bacterium]|nr:hypothetical protein [Planctomycetota bacterium]